MAVIGSDVNAATGNDGSGMRFSAEFSGPFDVLAGFEIEGLGQAAFAGDHVARPGLAPLGLVGSEERKARGFKEHDPEERQGASSKRAHECGDKFMARSWSLTGAW